jgi:very-short-patch-repair endonuclease
VHRFQGDERDVMFFSPVYSNGMPDGAAAFLKNSENIFNVAITRARAQLIVVGDLHACGSCSISYLASLAQYSQNLLQTSTRDINSAIGDLGPQYPVVSNPEQVSDWEKLFYEALYRAGIRPIPQYQVEKYVQDFALFHGERKLNIEVDSKRYHSNWTGELCRRDQIRNQRMFELGWDVMRFWVYEVRDNLDDCVRRVQRWMQNI